MKRYSIMVREYGSDHSVELMQCDTNPQALVDGLRKKMLTIRHSIFEKGKRTSKVPKYNYIDVIDHAPR